MKATHSGGGKMPVRPAVVTGQHATALNVGWASQIGAAQGNHTMHGPTNYRGEAMQAAGTPSTVPMGNKVALNVNGGGPGAGRTIHHCGSQQGGKR